MVRMVLHRMVIYRASLGRPLGRVCDGVDLICDVFSPCEVAGNSSIWLVSSERRKQSFQNAEGIGPVRLHLDRPESKPRRTRSRCNRNENAVVLLRFHFPGTPDAAGVEPTPHATEAFGRSLSPRRASMTWRDLNVLRAHIRTFCPRHRRLRRNRRSKLTRRFCERHRFRQLEEAIRRHTERQIRLEEEAIDASPH
jgi:hypothetical protein